jgi:uncharacterized membrane protein YkvA (DUF1232 family)
MNFSLESIYTWYRNTIRNPKYRWWVIGASMLYLISPIDIAPDFLPIIGWIDDGVIATLLVAEVSQLLLERLKSSKETTASTASAADAQPTASATAATVDVNAMPVS